MKITHGCGLHIFSSGCKILRKFGLTPENEERGHIFSAVLCPRSPLCLSLLSQQRAASTTIGDESSHKWHRTLSRTTPNQKRRACNHSYINRGSLPFGSTIEGSFTVLDKHACFSPQNKRTVRCDKALRKKSWFSPTKISNRLLRHMLVHSL